MYRRGQVGQDLFEGGFTVDNGRKLKEQDEVKSPQSMGEHQLSRFPESQGFVMRWLPSAVVYATPSIFRERLIWDRLTHSAKRADAHNAGQFVECSEHLTSEYIDMLGKLGGGRTVVQSGRGYCSSNYLS